MLSAWALCAFALVSLSLAQAPSTPVTPTVASVRAEIARLKADMASLWTMAHSLSLLPNGAPSTATPASGTGSRAKAGQQDAQALPGSTAAVGSPHGGRNLLINGGPVLKFEVRSESGGGRGGGVWGGKPTKPPKNQTTNYKTQPPPPLSSRHAPLA